MTTDVELELKQQKANFLIHAFAVAHGSLAFLLANTVILDGPILAGLTVWMIQKLGKLYGKEDVNGYQVFWNIFAYVSGTWLASRALFFIPGLGNWASAAATMLITEIIGWACIIIFSNNLDPASIPKEQWKKIIKEAKKEGKKSNRENKEVLSKATKDEKNRLKFIGDKLRDDNISDEDKEELLNSLTKIYEEIKNR
jgi:uncharacterized protein (DUF697 family)